MMNGSESISFKEDLLGRDIRRLGRLLGEAIRAQQGEQVFDQIESIRKLAICFRRDQDADANADLHAALNAMSIDDTTHLVIFRCWLTSRKTSTTSGAPALIWSLAPRRGEAVLHMPWNAYIAMAEVPNYRHSSRALA